MSSGCGCKEVYRFLILLIPTPLVSALFCSSIPTFCSFYIYSYHMHKAGVCSLGMRPK